MVVEPEPGSLKFLYWLIMMDEWADLRLIISISAVFGTSCFIGGFFVKKLRDLCLVTADMWRVASLCYFFPITIYIALNVFVFYGIMLKMIADCFTFGLLLGMTRKLMQKPSCAKTLRILVRSNKWDSTPRLLWLHSPDATAKEAIAAIGDDLGIMPHSRISIETGRGSFVTEVDKPLLQQISYDPPSGFFNAGAQKRSINKDFFGFTTAVCNIVIRDEEVLDDSDDELEEVPTVGQRPTNLTTLIAARGSVRWKDNLLLKANVSASGGYDDFSVACVNHYASAAPPPQGMGILQSMKSETVRFVPFNERVFDDNNSETRSELSATTSKSHGSSWSLFKTKPAHPHLVTNNVPVRDGDTIVIASKDGKFMSIRSGWWISWTENDPRRSGAFKIEITERAPQIFTDLARSIGSKVNIKPKLSAAALELSEGKGDDTALRTGDFFRLRSVKFPEYELGITSKHVEGDHCYLGLHKAQLFGVEEDENVWCHTTRFTVRFGNTIVF